MSRLQCAWPRSAPAPRRALVRRPRLVGRLPVDTGRLSRLVLVCAPAAFGKTTLLTQWLDDWRSDADDWPRRSRGCPSTPRTTTRSGSSPTLWPPRRRPYRLLSPGRAADLRFTRRRPRPSSRTSCASPWRTGTSRRCRPDRGPRGRAAPGRTVAGRTRSRYESVSGAMADTGVVVSTVLGRPEEHRAAPADRPAAPLVRERRRRCPRARGPPRRRP